jgi:hypothetical protein
MDGGNCFGRQKCFGLLNVICFRLKSMEGKQDLRQRHVTNSDCRSRSPDAAVIRPFRRAWTSGSSIIVVGILRVSPQRLDTA